MGNKQLLSILCYRVPEKHEKQISDGIKMKTTFVFLLAMVLSISGSEAGLAGLPREVSQGLRQANAKVGKRIENLAHIAKVFFRAKLETPCKRAVMQCTNSKHRPIVKDPFDILAECCKENKKMCLSDPKLCGAYLG